MKTFIVAIATLVFALTANAEEPKQINSVEFRGTVDVIHIKLQQGKLWVESYVGKPTRMAVNSRTFLPKWQGHRSETFTKFEGQWKPFKGSTCTIDVKRGRSVVEIVEQPSEANDWTLTVKIADQPNDSDEYKIRINW